MAAKRSQQQLEHICEQAHYQKPISCKDQEGGVFSKNIVGANEWCGQMRGGENNMTEQNSPLLTQNDFFQLICMLFNLKAL